MQAPVVSTAFPAMASIALLAGQNRSAMHDQQHDLNEAATEALYVLLLQVRERPFRSARVAAATVLPTATLQFLAPPLTVTVSSGQAVIVSSQVTLGTASTTTPAHGLRLWICQQASGGAISAAHPIDWIAPQAGPTSLNVYSLTDTLTPGDGQFAVGLCGQLLNGGSGWDANDWAYTTAQVIGGASVVSAAAAKTAEATTAGVATTREP